MQGQQKGDLWHKSNINGILHLSEARLNLFCRKISHWHGSFSKKGSSVFVEFWVEAEQHLCQTDTRRVLLNSGNCDLEEALHMYALHAEFLGWLKGWSFSLKELYLHDVDNAGPYFCLVAL